MENLPIDEVLKVFISLGIGKWILEGISKWKEKKNQRNKKLRSLLYLMVDLRFYLKNLYSHEKSISDFTDEFLKRLSEEFGDSYSRVNANELKEIQSKILRNSHFIYKEDEAEIDEKINIILVELSEIYPLFTFELKTKLKKKDYLKGLKSYFNQLESEMGDMPFDITKWMKPKFTQKIISDLDYYIIEIASKIGCRTKKRVQAKLDKPIAKIEQKNQSKFIDEYVLKIKEQEKHNNNT